MNIKKQKCGRCEGKGCVDCSYSGVRYRNTEFDSSSSANKEKDK